MSKAHDWRAEERVLSPIMAQMNRMKSAPVWRCSRCGAEQWRDVVPGYISLPPDADYILKVNAEGCVVDVVRRRGRARGCRYFTCGEWIVEQVHGL